MTDTQDPIRSRSDALLHLIKEKTGVDFDYSLFTLLYLDKVLEQLFGPGMSKIPKEGMDDVRKSLRLQIACAYGECIRETFSGEWEQDEKLGLCLKNVGNQKVTILPLSTAEDRMNGDDSKLFAAAKAVCGEVFKQVGENFYTSGGQSAAPNGE